MMARVLVWAVIIAVIVAGVLFVKREPSARRPLQLAAVVVMVALLARSSVTQGRFVLLQPPIHDISTDLDDPPAFEAIAKIRTKAAYDGPAAATAQRRAYPEVQPIVLTVPPAEAFRRAAQASTDMGWALVAEDEAAGRIEATATTFLVGYKDDIVIRVRAAEGGSRVDIRSKSRVGEGDFGANAARIRAFTARMQAAR
jgi:uncharacterized protein (DUF1499 family)